MPALVLVRVLVLVLVRVLERVLERVRVGQSQLRPIGPADRHRLLLLRRLRATKPLD